ncbi:hypothetical protein QJQ45_024369 [Haematococcus lacustris]|nr:hypothetical protein QJQ45_024369 [Haematococcus lacustris]
MKDAVLQLAEPAYTSQEQPDGYVRRLEAACQLLHEGLKPTQTTGAQTASHKAATAAAAPTPPASGIISAGKLCTLLLTEQDLLDVVLALHDVRAAQLCHLMPWSGSHPLKLPPPSEALAKQLSQSQRSVPGSQLLAFVSALNSDNSLEGNPLLRVWDSMHRTMLLVLAALQSLPIRPHPQHPDPAATTHTSTTPQLPPGYHRCSACLLLSLRLATCLAQHCVEQPLDKDLALARLHGTLPGLLLGLSTAVTVMQAAGHPEAKAQRVQFVRCLLHLGQKSSVTRKDPKASKNSSSRHHGSSRGPRGGTGRSGAAQSAGDKPHALAVDNYMYLAQALCDVFGRQEEVFAFEELITTCEEEGPDSSDELWTDVTNFGGMALMVLYEHSTDLSKTLKDPARATSRTGARVAASRRSTAGVSVPLLVSDILSFLARFLPEFRAARVTVELAATIGRVGEQMAEIFLTGLSAMFAELYQAVVKLTGLMPDWRRRPAVLRAGLRVAIAGALSHNTLVSLLTYMEDTPTTAQRFSKMEAKVSYMSIQVTHLWSLVLAQDGVNKPPTGPFQMDGDFIHRMTMDRVAVLPSPSSPQLVPLALDLVLGMEHMLQMVMRQQDMVWKWPYWDNGNLVQGLADGYRTLLALFGHVIEVLATPSVVGPAGLAARPASWLPCGNSLVEGWSTRLIERVCDLLYIATPASKAFPFLFKIMLSRGLQDSYRLLLRGQRQAPSSMSPEAERLLACLTLVLTAMVPQELCLAFAGGMTVPGLDKTLEKEGRAMRNALSKLQPEQVWTWQALAAGTPAEVTLQGSLPALATMFWVWGLVRPTARGWRPQRLTVAMGDWHESLSSAVEAATSATVEPSTAPALQRTGDTTCCVS